MVISLWTSRIVLDQLGTVDYGIYNVVGSLVLLFTFIQGSLSSSASRYLAYEIGVGTRTSLNRMFCMTVNIHWLFALLILLFSETAGLWYFYHKMVFPPERQFAAFVVYQLSNISAIITLLTVPYNSMLIAQERMKEFAYLSIVEALAKLGIAFCLYVDGMDKLIIYGLLLFLTHLFICLLYYMYCRRIFVAARFTYYWNWKIFKDMMAYNGWSIGSYISANFVGQVTNLLLNMFFGPIVNAARAISYQIQANVSKFVVNFQMALNPQIIKQYATGNKNVVESLSNMSIKISFSLLLVIMFPLLVNIDFLLSLWLKEVPQHTNTFVVLVGLSTVFGSMANVFSVIAQAANRLKLFTLATMPLYVLSIPLCYFFLKLGATAELVLALSIIIQLLELLLQYVLARYIMRSRLRNNLGVILRCIFTTIIFCIIGWFIYANSLSGILYSLCSIVTTFLFAGFWCLFFIIEKHERLMLLSFVKSKICKK